MGKRYYGNNHSVGSDRNDSFTSCFAVMVVIALVFLFLFSMSSGSGNKKSVQTNSRTNTAIPQSASITYNSVPSSSTKTPVSFTAPHVSPTKAVTASQSSEELPTVIPGIKSSDKFGRIYDSHNDRVLYYENHDPGSKVIKSLENGSKVEILSDEEYHMGCYWYKIKPSESLTGWIPSSFIKNYIGQSSTGNNPTPKPTPRRTSTPRLVYTAPVKVTWHCVDATSFDGDGSNDNKCISSTGQVRYVWDSEAERLDPSYHAYHSGASYYNY